MEFYYHMYGDDVNQLNVYSRRSSGGVTFNSTLLWERRGNQGNRWLRGVVKLPNEYIQLVIEGVGSRKPRNNIAIDDITISKCELLGK